MATNPYFTQLHTQRFSFVGNPQQRDGAVTNFDQRFLNVYPELIPSPISEGKKYYLKKRPGLQAFLQQGPPTVGTGGRGVYFWNNTLYSVVGNQLFANTGAIYTFGTTTGDCGFTLYQFTNGTVNLIVTDGNTMVQVDIANGVTILFGYPIPHVPMPVYMDGYLFVAQLNGPGIYNSNLDDPGTWPTDGFIDVEMFAYPIQALVRNMNYVVAVTLGSVEFFYDNANATGSPLQRNAPAVSQLGTPAPYTVNQTETEIILVGQTGNGGRTVWLITGFQPKEIAIEPIREALDTEGGLISLAHAFTIQVAGHKFYVLNLFSLQRTFVYDFDEQMWHEWSSGPGKTAFKCNWATDSGNNLAIGASGFPILQDTATGLLYQFSPYEYTDSGDPINCQIQTIKLDFDTVKRKRFVRLSIVGDAPFFDSNVSMSVQWSDDDYTTFGPNPGRNMLLNGDYCTITNLGMGRRRAFLFVYQQPHPLRLEAFEVDITQEVRR